VVLIDRRTVRVLFTSLIFLGTLGVIYLAWRTFIVFLFATFFAYVIEPIVDALERLFKGARGAAIVVVYAGLLLVIGLVAGSVGPKVADEGRRLSETLPGIIEQVGSGDIAEAIGGKLGWSGDTRNRVKQFLASHQQDLTDGLHSIAAPAAEVLAGLGWVLLIPILAVFFLKDKSAFGDNVVSMFKTTRNRRFVTNVVNDLDAMLGTYIRAQLLLSIFAFIAYTAFLLIVQFPYSFAIAAIAALLELIPFVGPLVTAVLVITIAFVTSFPHWIALIIFMGAWRLIQDYVSTPLLFKRGLEMHPLMIIFAILLGGEIAGVVGMFLMIPAVAAIRILYDHWTSQEIVGEDDVETTAA